jgi:hypothetical protein
VPCLYQIEILNPVEITMAVRHKTSNRYNANLGRNTMGIKSVTAEAHVQARRRAMI